MAIKWKSLSSESDLDEIEDSSRLDMHASGGPVLRGQRQVIGGVEVLSPSVCARLPIGVLGLRRRLVVK